jgi:hypothetical protein
MVLTHSYLFVWLRFYSSSRSSSRHITNRGCPKSNDVKLLEMNQLSVLLSLEVLVHVLCLTS